MKRGVIGRLIARMDGWSIEMQLAVIIAGCMAVAFPIGILLGKVVGPPNAQFIPGVIVGAVFVWSYRS